MSVSHERTGAPKSPVRLLVWLERGKWWCRGLIGKGTATQKEPLKGYALRPNRETCRMERTLVHLEGTDPDDTVMGCCLGLDGMAVGYSVEVWSEDERDPKNSRSAGSSAGA